MSFQRNALYFALGLSFTSAQNALASDAINIPHIPGKIIVDAQLDEGQWQTAHKIPVNIVTYPWDNSPSPIFTEARIFENGEKLFVAFIAHDPNPQNIQAFLSDRDTAFNDDLVGVKLDTFNDHRLAYKFYVNALGVQNDGIENVMTGSNDNLWDGIWESKGNITEDGYVVEIAIPFNILNFENSNDVKTWAIELFRLYPRDNRLRISNISIDKNNDCWVCQMKEIKGFEHSKMSKHMLLTPSLVSSRNESRDVYQTGSEWQSENNSDLGLNLRWGINSSNLLNATINPDFSTVEVDAGQLSINNNFSLYYDEKRPFFLENADYFNVSNNLIYTRNIADPDVGVKFTGREGDHTYGVFVTDDSKTNIHVPGNNNSDVTTLNEKSHNAALKYRFDVSHDLSFSFVSTLRKSDSYHNNIAGFDGKYRLTESDSITGQIIHSDTQYPDQFSNSFVGELAQRTASSDSFSGSFINLEYNHESENWAFETEYKRVSQGFRADLGFVSEVDIKGFELEGSHTWYGDQHSWWQEVKTKLNTEKKYATGGGLIGQTASWITSVDGPLLSYVELIVESFKKIGLRHDATNLAIDNNADLFSGEQAEIYGEFRPHKRLHLNGSLRLGKEVDYANNRLGNLLTYSAGAVWNIDKHAEVDVTYQNSRLRADGSEIYNEDLVNFKFAYQFDLQSHIKLNMVYSNADRNLNNYPMFESPSDYFYQQDKGLSTQLIYAYKLNPQSVFYLGYSDNALSNDDIDSLRKDHRTAFLKFSYAWMM